MNGPGRAGSSTLASVRKHANMGAISVYHTRDRRGCILHCLSMPVQSILHLKNTPEAFRSIISDYMKPVKYCLQGSGSVSLGFDHRLTGTRRLGDVASRNCKVEGACDTCFCSIRTPSLMHNCTHLGTNKHIIAHPGHHDTPTVMYGDPLTASVHLLTNSILTVRLRSFCSRLADHGPHGS